jgi:hypothetical protein
MVVDDPKPTNDPKKHSAEQGFYSKLITLWNVNKLQNAITSYIFKCIVLHDFTFKYEKIFHLPLNYLLRNITIIFNISLWK